MNDIKAHLSEVNTCIKQIDPNEDNPSLNSALQSLNLAMEAVRVVENKLAMINNDLKQL